MSKERIQSHLYDWQINQRINFSHNNQLYLKPQPRQVREVIGQSLPPLDSGKTEALVYVVAFIVALVSGILKFAL